MDGMTIKRGRGRPRKDPSKAPVRHPMDPDIVILQGRRPESPDLWEAVITLEGKATNPRSLQTTNRDEALLKSWQLKRRFSQPLRVE